MQPPYLLGIQVIPERVADFEQHPFSVPCVRSLNLSFNSQVTFLVGENGSGKSALLEAIVVRMPLAPLWSWTGGSRSAARATRGNIVGQRAAFPLIPYAEILLIDGASISTVLLEDTEHYRVTKAVLQNPVSFWKHLTTSQE